MKGGAYPKCPKGEIYDRVFHGCKKESDFINKWEKPIYNEVIDDIDFQPGDYLKDIKINGRNLTDDDLRKKVFPGKQVRFTYDYNKREEGRDFDDMEYYITTGTTLKDVLIPLVLWGLNYRDQSWARRGSQISFRGFQHYNIFKKISWFPLFTEIRSDGREVAWPPW